MTGAAGALDRSSTGAAFLRAAGRRPSAIALRWESPDGPRALTYAELARRAQGAAAALSARVEPGERVAIWSANCPEWVVAQLAAALAGAVLVPLNPVLTEDEAAYVVDSAGAGIVVTGPEWRGRDLAASAGRLAVGGAAVDVLPLVEWTAEVGEADATLPVVDADDPALIQYTSGTTGTPKGAVLSHRVTANVGPLCHLVLGLTEQDVVCSPLPFHHVGGSVCTVLATLLRGGTFVLLPGFDAAQTLATLARDDVTFFGGVPTMMIAMLELCGDRPPDLPALRRVMVGGTTVAPELITRIERAFGVEVFNGYGQSEAPSALQTRSGDSAEVKALTIGRADQHREVSVRDPGSGAELPPGAVGELCLRGLLTMDGYWEERNATQSSAFDDDGWLHTGDVAARDEDGVVTLHGRLRDVIIRGGENVYPAEVEAVLATHPSVAEVAVVAAPDPFWGEVPAAFIRASAPFDPAELEAFARQRLASFKVPRVWRSVEAFPVTASGKVQKFRLVEQLRR